MVRPRVAGRRPFPAAGQCVAAHSENRSVNTASGGLPSFGFGRGWWFGRHGTGRSQRAAVRNKANRQGCSSGSATRAGNGAAANRRARNEAKPRRDQRSRQGRRERRRPNDACAERSQAWAKSAGWAKVREGCRPNRGGAERSQPRVRQGDRRVRSANGLGPPVLHRLGRVVLGRRRDLSGTVVRCSDDREQPGLRVGYARQAGSRSRNP